VTDEQILDIDGRRIPVTNPGKVVFPERGETKLEAVKRRGRDSNPRSA
jgi:hypothetical protein